MTIHITLSLYHWANHVMRWIRVSESDYLTSFMMSTEIRWDIWCNMTILEKWGSIVQVFYQIARNRWRHLQKTRNCYHSLEIESSIIHLYYAIFFTHNLWAPRKIYLNKILKLNGLQSPFLGFRRVEWKVLYKYVRTIMLSDSTYLYFLYFVIVFIFTQKYNTGLTGSDEWAWIIN